MVSPHTSIIITNYNYGRFVARCIGQRARPKFTRRPRSSLWMTPRGINHGTSSRVTERAWSRCCWSATPDKVPRSTRASALATVTWCYFSTRTTGCTRTRSRARSPHSPRASRRCSSASTCWIVTVVKLDLLPPPEVSFDDGDVVPILLSRGRYENTVTSGNAFRRETLCLDSSGAREAVPDLCGRLPGDSRAALRKDRVDR